MSNSVQHKRSDVPGAIPVAADLRVGELAINLADRLMFTKDSTDAIIPLVIQGVNGLSVLSGVGPPIGGIGMEGEFYIDVTPYNIYGPKAAGVWGAATSLIGPQGPAGLDGVDGTSVTIKGSAPWATISAIVGPAVNDMWILTEATGAPVRPDASPAQVGDGVSWNGSSWLNLGPIRGPVGPAGATGATGAPGPAGVDGVDGSDGIDGADGAMWYSGGTAPLAGLGVDGDLFLLLTNGDLYQKIAGEWTVIDNLMGPQGPAGTNGTNGAAGAAGSVWYSAAGAPGAGTGVNGDYYLNTSNGDYYQKVSGTWTLRGNLTGPTGQGVIPGGAAGQVLTKASATDYATQWSTPAVAPTDHGLLTGLADDDHTQYLTQARGDARYYTESEVDTKIAAVPVIPAGGTTGQVLAKVNSTNYNTQWSTPATGVTDHGALTGLADDDHPQYLNQARGDARYYTEAEVNALIAGVPNHWTLTGSDIANSNAGNVGIGGVPGLFKLGVTGAANITESLSVGIPVDFWAGTPNGFFTLVGRPGGLLGWVGSAGSNRVVIGSNAYRNASSGTSYLGAGGVINNGSQIELAPQGDIFFKNGPASGINLTQRMLIAATGAVTINDLSGTGNRMVTASATGVLATSAMPLSPTSGTFASPSLNGATGVTYSANRFVRWTRMGDVVVFCGRIQWVALTQTSTSAVILCGTGMPEPAVYPSGYEHTVMWGRGAGVDFNANALNNGLYVDWASSTLRLVPFTIQDTTDTIANYTYNSFQNTGYIEFNGSYFTDAP